MNGSHESIEPRKSHGWLIFLIIILILALAGTIGWWWYSKNKNSPINTSSTPSTATTENSTPAKDNWVRDATFVMKSTTSTCTVKLDDGTLRMYLMKDGKIVYQDSADGKSYGTPVASGITQDSGMFVSNPAVLKIANGKWIMVYEQMPTPADAKQQPAGPATQRNLYSATSTDGKLFTKAGVAIDSAKDDGYFASVPDLILLPDGKIRLYYVSSGQAISSAISADSGKTWTRESGLRLSDNAVDPDVLLSTENGKTKYVMYYSVLSQTTNQIYKSTSSDGLIWQEGVGVLQPSTSSMTVIDPDVVKIVDNKYLMYFGEASSSGTSGGSINLYLSEMNGNIF